MRVAFVVSTVLWFALIAVAMAATSASAQSGGPGGYGAAFGGSGGGFGRRAIPPMSAQQATHFTSCMRAYRRVHGNSIAVINAAARACSR